MQTMTFFVELAYFTLLRRLSPFVAQLAFDGGPIFLKNNKESWLFRDYTGRSELVFHNFFDEKRDVFLLAVNNR